MYLFDFFLEPTDSAESFIEETTGITLSKYPRIFKAKLALGRAKDIFDYQMWDLFDEFKADNLSEEEYLMFQKPIQYNPEQQEAIRMAGEFIADRNAKEDFFLISGKAGTGKTTIINEIVNNEANRLGRLPSVFITAIANKAVLNLDAKIEAPHVKKATASALGFYESVKSNGEKTWKKPKDWRLDKLPVSHADILFIDECSMLDTAKLDMILQIKRQLPDLKIVMIGDRGQIHSIEDKDSDNTLVSDEDKEGFAPSVVFTYKNKKEAALLTRVR
jgi:DNA replication protein DnaC